MSTDLYGFLLKFELNYDGRIGLVLRNEIYGIGQCAFGMFVSVVLRRSAVFTEKRLVKSRIFGKSDLKANFVYGHVCRQNKFSGFLQSEIN